MSKRTHPWTAFRSMQAKLLLLVCTITLLSALIMTWVNQVQTYRVARGATIEQLASEADLVAAALSEAIRNLRNDAQIIGQTPPVQGLARTAANGGIDPLGGATDGTWRTRLASIFSSTMQTQTRPSYMQMRYIGLSDGGRELVRVNHVNGENFVVEPNLLQQKGDEHYFQAGLAVAPDGAYLSDVTWNREFGEVDPREIPTIRLLLPIATSDGTPFGFIAINADYEALLRQAIATTTLANRLLISNQNGDFLATDPGQTHIRFGYHADHTYQAHPLLGHVTASHGPTRGEFDGEIFATRQIEFSDIETPLDLRVTVLRDTASVNAAALENLPVIVISSVILILASLSVTVLAINHVMRPFRALSTRIESAGSLRQIEDFPIERVEEVGTLARAFSDVTAGLVSSEARTRAIIEGIAEGVIVIDEAGHIETFNPACERMFNYRADALIGTNISLLIPSDSANGHDGFLARRADGELTDVIGTVREVHGVRKNGSRFPMELSVSEIELPGGRLYCGIVRDISQHTQVEQVKDGFIAP
ncbi:PAS domain S-box protein [Maricaulis sp. W15]|uniref:PAS domain S-box protein n=1 Tax=Maricaulis sp. W15 TaxID=1772333 RepID=UPI000A939B4E|nr:PAS domain S-box protein [Maricaulis sp. W15]